MTSEATGLAASDADARWIGVRRHQAVLAVLGVGLVGDGVVRARSPMAEVFVGIVLLLAMAPATDGLSVAELASVAARFVARSRWSSIVVTARRGGVRVEARGHAAVRTYRLVHVGRLDLAGRDRDVAHDLARFVDALAAVGENQHVSWHVRSEPDSAQTMLAVDGDAPPPAGWVGDVAVAHQVVGVRGGHAELYERWSYVRGREAVRAVLRVRDFTSSVPGQAVLARAQLVSDQTCLAVHAAVVPTSRGRRLAERAVHRHRSDGASSAAAGFRRTARVEHAFERLREREAQVASGRALVRLGVFVTVRAQSASELREEVGRVRRALSESGLRTERGRGRQAEWFCRQLPGGPGW